jgi:hypothetical protein
MQVFPNLIAPLAVVILASGLLSILYSLNRFRSLSLAFKSVGVLSFAAKHGFRFVLKQRIECLCDGNQLTKTQIAEDAR